MDGRHHRIPMLIMYPITVSPERWSSSEDDSEGYTVMTAGVDPQPLDISTAVVQNQVPGCAMEPLTGIEIRDFTIRGNYLNYRSLLARQEFDLSAGKLWSRPGYSPPVVQFTTERGETSSIAVRELDLPLLSQDDLDKTRTYLSLICKARAGDAEAAQDLADAARQHPPHVVRAGERPQPDESRFVVPSTSSGSHSEQKLSQKGSILLKLSQMGCPVPDFAVLTSEVYLDRAEHLEDHLSDAIHKLETLTMQSLGNSQDPLVMAIRCATAHYIPGVMDTYLNVGVTERALPCLEEIYGAAVARRMFLNNLRNLCHALGCEDPAVVSSAGQSDLPPHEVLRLMDRLAEAVRRSDRRLLEDSFFQAAFFAKLAYSHFEDNQDLLYTLFRGTQHYPCLILQKMVCTVRHEFAYAGVLSSRHTQTGLGTELQTARNIFGEEIMTGTAEVESTVFDDRQAIEQTFPAVYHFAPHLPELEREFESPVTIEFAAEATPRCQWFALLQLNETGMAGRAAVMSVMNLHKSGAITRKRVTELIRPYHIKQLTSDTIDQEEFNILNSFCSGVAVLPRSAVSARVYFTGDVALKAKRGGEKVCLCKKTFLPTDTVVMRELDAILSLTSAAIHVVTICQSLGIPALLSLEKHGVSLQPPGRLVSAAGREIQEGDWITISSRRRSLYEGKAKFKPARLLRYMRGEPVQFDGNEKETFDAIAYAYRYYLQLIKGLKAEQISTLDEVTRLVNFELREQSEDARQLVNGWFDGRETLYMEQVLKSDIGDHLGQSRVYDMLTPDRKILFFKLAAAKCAREGISGYEAGAFMLGRFLSLRCPVAFWKRFTPAEIGLLVNEWVLFEKYMQILYNVGERAVLQTRKQLLKDGLDELYLHPGNVAPLMTLKLSGAPLDEAKNALPSWADPQSAKVLELLQRPYHVFYNFNAEWSVGKLQKLCQEENVPVPGAEEA